MRRYFCLTLASLTLVSCSNNVLGNCASAQENTSNFSALIRGMHQTEVFSIMGTPYQSKTFCGETDHYDVWFYITRSTTLDQTRMMPHNLTPLAFKNGILMGWGYAYYNFFMNTYWHPDIKIQINKPKETPSSETEFTPSSNNENEENKHFEELLQKANQPTTAPTGGASKSTPSQKQPTPQRPGINPPQGSKNQPVQ